MAAPDITFAAAIIGKTATFEWRQSLNKVPWLKVSNNVYQSPVGTAPETDDFIFHPTVVGTYYLQVQVKWSRTLFADVRYQTRLITIDVLPESVATTGLSVDVDHPICFQDSQPRRTQPSHLKMPLIALPGRYHQQTL